MRGEPSRRRHVPQSGSRCNSRGSPVALRLGYLPPGRPGRHPGLPGHHSHLPHGNVAKAPADEHRAGRSDRTEVRFKLTPAGKDLPPATYTPANGWPTPPPPFETVRQRTLEFLEASHAQVAIDSHFFAPFPTPNLPYAHVIGLAASRGDVYSAFESPVQNYAIVTDSPAINIDRSNNAGVVHRDPNFADGKHVIEDVELWNALAGSGQIVTNGVKSIPEYIDATHPNALLISRPPPGATSPVYSNSNSWYNLLNAVRSSA